MSITAHKPAGSKAGNQYGQFSVRYASASQQKFIAKLLNERDHKLGDIDPSTMNVQQASETINALLRTPVRGDKIAPASAKQLDFIRNLSAQRDGADSFLKTQPALDSLNAYQAKLVIDGLLALPAIKKEVAPVGAYNHNGQIYSIRESRTTNRRHAFEWDGEKAKWSYAGWDITFAIKPDEILSLAEAMRFGAQTGVCVHCGRTLTNKNSVRYGMGDTCFKKYA